jgi:putative flippase GtrA
VLDRLAGTGLLRQLATFGAVGIAATLTHVTVAWAVFAGLGHPVLVANLVGAFAAFFVSFLGSARFTFRTRRPLHRSAPRYAVLTLVSFGLASAIMAFVESRALSGLVYAAAVLCVVPPTNFAIARLWVFPPDAA